MTDKRKIAPDEGPHGVDRWTSNGYGITVNGKKVEPPDEKDTPETQEIDDIEEE